MEINILVFFSRERKELLVRTNTHIHREIESEGERERIVDDLLNNMDH